MINVFSLPRGAAYAPLLTACVLTLSACGSGGGGGDDTPPPGVQYGPYETTISQTAPPETTTVTVGADQLPTSGIGEVLVGGPNNLTLYTFKNDAPNDSNCNNIVGEQPLCADIWPPMFAADNAQPKGDFTIVTRDDGTKQWAFKQYPLYFYYLDTQEGEFNGELVGNVWYVARPDPVNIADIAPSPDLVAGEIFVARGQTLQLTDGSAGENADPLQYDATVRYDKDRFTLYTFSNDPGDNTSVCNGGCATVWPPLYADRDSRPSGDLTLATRDDGSLQWAWRGYPLYYYDGNAAISAAGDTAPGETRGQLVNSVWFVVRPDPFQSATLASGDEFLVGKGEILDLGNPALNPDNSPSVDPLLVDASARRSVEGLTLYTFDNDPGDGTSICNGGCADVWPPLYADLMSITPSADFKIITRDNGSEQWAYKGKPLYLFAGRPDLGVPADTQAGDIFGLQVPNWSLATLSPIPVAATLASIQANIFTPECAYCHSGASPPAGLDLSSEANTRAFTVNVDASEKPTLKIILPGDPDNSWLIRKVEGNIATDGSEGLQMPRGADPLSGETIALLRQWVLLGAK